MRCHTICMLSPPMDAGSITGAVSGIFALPIPLILGWLSDRSGRKTYLYLAYNLGIVSLAILAVSRSLWQFSIALGSQAMFSGLNSSVENAFVIDLVPKKSLGRGLALAGATSWIGGILGFAGTGFALQELGVLPTFAIGISLALVAIFLLIPIRARC